MNNEFIGTKKSLKNDEEYKKEDLGPVVKDQGRLKTKILRIYNTL